MARLKVTLAAIDAPEVPAWVVPQLVENDIEIAIHECTTQNELLQYAGDADVVWLFGGSRILTPERLGLLPKCKAIIRTGSGTDNIPVQEATRLGILVANTPEAVADAVAEHAVGLWLALVRQIARQDRAVRRGIWDRNYAWPDWHLAGQTFGLVGFGRIAQRVARKISGFEMNVLAHDPYVPPETMAKHRVGAATLNELLSRSDFVSIHCPLSPETFRLIGERELRWMKTRSVLINTSRGPVIDENALIRALTEGWIAGAALDVLEKEPPDPNHPLRKLENIVLTPHIAGYSDQFYDNMWRFSVETAIDLAQGRLPRSYVNPAVASRWAPRG